MTALSQRYNLYFLACNDIIHVYQPSFPDQKISNEPQLILHLPVSPHAAEGGIDPLDPHSVTRILVDYLGREEILLVACDDGDVVGYRVHEIQRALEGQQPTSECELACAVEHDPVKFFFHRNVGASAWGLAVHQNARIIAISANTHKITVLAFALSDPLPSCQECLPSPAGFENRDVAAINTGESRCLRKEDLVFELSADNNIPAVSFNNTGDDPTCHWLFSCSIDGKTILWDLHKPGKPSAVFQMGWCASVSNPSSAPAPGPGRCACEDCRSFPHGIWGAYPLETQSAYEVSTEERGGSMESRMVEPCFEDVTEQRNWFAAETTTPNIFKQPYEATCSAYSEDADMMVLDNDSDSSASDSEAGSSQGQDSEHDEILDHDSMSIDADEEEKSGSDRFLPGTENVQASMITPTTSSHVPDLIPTPVSR